MALHLNSEAEKAAVAPAEEAVKAKASAAAVEESIPADVLGSKSATLTLVATLGDPTRDDITIREVQGKPEGERVVTPTIVGYEFIASEDLVVPECGLGDDARSNPMSYKELAGTRKVKAGQPIALTRMETGILLSRPEYNARINGGDKEFVVAYQKSNRGAQGGEAAKAAAQGLPTVALRGNGISVKDIPCKPVLTFSVKTEKTADGKDKRVFSDKAPVAGYEKWAPLCIAHVRKASAGAPTTPANERNKNAALFLAAIQKKASVGK